MSDLRTLLFKAAHEGFRLGRDPGVDEEMYAVEAIATDLLASHEEREGEDVFRSSRPADVPATGCEPDTCWACESPLEDGRCTDVECPERYRRLRPHTDREPDGGRGIYLRDGSWFAFLTGPGADDVGPYSTPGEALEWLQVGPPVQPEEES